MLQACELQHTGAGFCDVPILEGVVVHRQHRRILGVSPRHARLHSTDRYFYSAQLSQIPPDQGTGYKLKSTRYFHGLRDSLQKGQLPTVGAHARPEVRQTDEVDPECSQHAQSYCQGQRSSDPGYSFQQQSKHSVEGGLCRTSRYFSRAAGIRSSCAHRELYLQSCRRARYQLVPRVCLFSVAAC